jgi:transcriptional regulator with XRE-family HTH domain
MDSTTRKALSENVKRLRLARKWNQTTLGQKAGVAQTLVSYVESPEGKSPTLETIEALAGALNVPAWTLLIPTDDLNPERMRGLDTLVSAYTTLPANGQDQVARVVDAERRYAKAS